MEIEKVSTLRTVHGEDGDVEVIDVTWKILAPAENGGEKTEGRKVIDTYWLVERALWRVSILSMQLLGMKRKDLPAFESTEELEAFMLENLPGQKATVEIEVFEKKDVERNRVKKVFAAA
jgi:hypothetical protein